MDIHTFGAFILGVVAVLGLLMALARTPPDHAKTNLTLWIEAIGFHRIPAWLRSFEADKWARRVGGFASLLAAIVGIVASLGNLNRSIPVRPLKPSENTQVSATSGATLPKSPFLGIDDADRWRLSNELRFQTVNLGNGTPCQARVWEKPQDETSRLGQTEMKDLIVAAGWRYEGGSTGRNIFFDGVSLNVATDNGFPFNCAYRLYELYQELKFTLVNIRPNTVSPELIGCKDCVEIVYGHLARIMRDA